MKTTILIIIIMILIMSCNKGSTTLSTENDVMKEEVNLEHNDYVPLRENESIVVESTQGVANSIYASDGNIKRFLTNIPRSNELSIGYSFAGTKVFFWRLIEGRVPTYGEILYFDAMTGEFIETNLASYAWYIDTSNTYIIISSDTDVISQAEKDKITKKYDWNTFAVIPKLYNIETLEELKINFDFESFVLSQEKPALVTMKLENHAYNNRFKIIYYLGNKGIILEGDLDPLTGYFTIIDE